MKGITKLPTIIQKNIKLVFRSYSSLLLLVLGPLLLILLVGFAFGGSALHDINIGIINPPKDVILSQIIPSKSDYTIFPDKEECLLSLKIEMHHACLEFSEDFATKNIEGKIVSVGEITLYFNNAQFNLANKLESSLEKQLQLTSDQITLSSAKKIIGDINEAVRSMQETQIKVQFYTERAQKIKDELEYAKETMIFVRSDYEQTSKHISEVLAINESLELSSQLNDLNKSFHENVENISRSIKSVETSIGKTEEYVNNNSNLSVNLSNARKNLIYIRNNLESASNTFDSFLANAYDYNALLANATASNAELLELYGNTSLKLNQSIARIEEDIIFIDSAIKDLERTNESLSFYISKFSGLEEEQALSLVNPIHSTFTTLLKDLEKISLIFPVLLVFIISFIGILLSNMNVLNELHSQASFRNFLVPVHFFVFAFGLFVTNVFMVSLQITVLLIIAYTQFSINFFPVLTDFIITTLLIMFIFILIGMCVAYKVKTKQNSIILSTFLALGFFLFSDVIFPLQTMPKLAAFFASLNPLVIGEEILRKLLFFNIPLSAQIGELLLLISYLIVLFILLYISAKKRKMAF